MGKWKLLITTLPVVFVVIALKLFLEKGLHFNGLIDFADVSMVLTGGVFLIGFMLAGTMADYKESEKLPGELATSLEALEESGTHLCAVNRYGGKPSIQDDRPVIDPALFINAHRTMIRVIHDWLYQRKTVDEVHARLHEYRVNLQNLEKLGGHGGAIGGMDREIANIRKVVTRVNVIARTGFIATGYALLEILICAIIVLVLVSRFKGAVAEVAIIGFVTLIYVYGYRLIKDIDDPFEYRPDGTPSGPTEIALFPLTDYMERFDQRNPEPLDQPKVIVADQRKAS